MKYSITTATLFAIATLAAPAALAGFATETQVSAAYAFESYEGTIQRVAPDGSSFVLTVEERQVTVQVHERTKFTLNGEASTKEAALVAGRNATVTVTDGTASKVAVTHEG